jgi:hypothetical protein
MLRHFGRLVWRQSRDMSVLNYPGHIVYEIYTNHGYIYVSENKTNHKIDVVKSNSIVDFSKSTKEQSQEVLLPVKQ